MNSRERVTLALNHREPDRVPLDLGGSATTGMHVSSVYRLRQALRLDPPGTPVKVVEPFQMLGEIAPDLVDALGVDVVPLQSPRNMFGFVNDGWRPWTTFDSTPVLVPAEFNTEPDEHGDILQYPEGDRGVAPSGRMPAGGFYHDAIIRQEPIDDATLRIEDNLQEFELISESDLAHFAREADKLYSTTDKAILASFGGTAFGDIALVPAVSLKRPRGIRDVAEWYMSTVARRDFVYEVFERQCEVGIANLERIHAVVGEKVSAVFVTGTDFGMQTGPFISPRAYRDLYRPFHRAVNDWIHAHTSWKSFIHSCGSIVALMPDLIEAGFDVFNPVQISATGMDPTALKRDFGDRVTFWGGGIDTQQALPFGSAEEVREAVRATTSAFAPDGGFVFNTVHNVQAGVPTANLVALYESLREFGKYVEW